MDMINKRKGRRGQSGFTLIELLVAVAILAILAGVAVFAVGNLTNDAGESACKSERDTIATAISAAKATSDPGDEPSNFLTGGLKYFDPLVEGAAGTADAGKFKADRKDDTETDVPEADCRNVPFT